MRKSGRATGRQPTGTRKRGSVSEGRQGSYSVSRADIVHAEFIPNISETRVLLYFSNHLPSKLAAAELAWSKGMVEGHFIAALYVAYPPICFIDKRRFMSSLLSLLFLFRLPPSCEVAFRLLPFTTDGRLHFCL